MSTATVSEFDSVSNHSEELVAAWTESSQLSVARHRQPLGPGRVVDSDVYWFNCSNESALLNSAISSRYPLNPVPPWLALPPTYRARPVSELAVFEPSFVSTS